MIKVGIIGAGTLGKQIFNQLATVNYIEPVLYNNEPVAFDYMVFIMDANHEPSLNNVVQRKDVIINTIENVKIEEECRKQNKVYLDARQHPNIFPETIRTHLISLRG